MRDFIDAILTFIEAATLSDEEFDALTIEAAALDAETYAAIDAVLDSREDISTAKDRLLKYFQAGGVDVGPIESPKSQIFVGGALES